MYDLTLLVKATIAGFVVALPVGVIGVICLQRAFGGRWLDGVIIGIGAALADSLLATAAALGLSLITGYLVEHKGPVRLVGGAVLIALGGRMLLRRRTASAVHTDPWVPPPQRWRAWIADIAAGFGLTIINPATLFAFIAVFAGLGLFAQDLDSLIAHWPIVLGVFSGSMLWWLTLNTAAALMRHHLPPGAIGVLNLILGTVVLVLGAASIVSVVVPAP